jgi:uncharacterized protein YaiI (UPF0178 family)
LHIFVDADACPRSAKEILYRIAERIPVHLTLVSNLYLRIPNSEYIHTIQVAGGFNMADDRLAELAGPDDLVITADIPLAARVVEKKALALDPRGILYTSDTIAERLTMRNMMDELRSSGVATGGPAGYSQKDRQQFAAQLEKILHLRQR